MKKPVDGNLLSPLPVVLTGAMVNNRPNYMVAGYIRPFDFRKIHPILRATGGDFNHYSVGERLEYREVDA
jgi:hypothetical protein